MGFVALLRFTLLCLDLLVWPAIALGYPLFASIRAVESGSKSQMKKLVKYWTLFSLFSLSEFAFVKIIEWIPVWSIVRLEVIFWLVVPHFDGSNHAYEGLVRPILLTKLQAVIDMFHQLEERICKRETVLDVIQKYIKENGPEAMEKLIALEYEYQKGIKSQKETKVLESEEKSTTAPSKQVSWGDTETFEATEKIETATKTHQALLEQSISVNRTDVVSNVKEAIPSEASADNRCPKTPPRMETQQEWTCDLCKVTAMSEMTLNDHLQGKKHKSKLESLKASLLGKKDTGSSPLVQHKQTISAAEVKELMPQKETLEMRCGETPSLKKAQNEWICDICNVTTMSEMILNAHLQGRKHMSKLETLKASKLTAEVTGGPSHSATNKVNHGNLSEKFIIKSGSPSEKIITSKVKIKAKVTTPSEASLENRHVKSPSIKQAQQEWSCDLCNVTTTSEMTLNEHVQGKKHKSELESLKASLFGAKDTGSSSLVTHETQSTHDLRFDGDDDYASHLTGKQHISNMEALISSGL